jgi:hypothetical protein
VLGFGAPEQPERRTARRLAALVVGVMWTLEAHYVTGTIDPWPMVAWGEALDMPWRRVRGAVDRLAGAGLAAVATAPFRPSSVHLARDRWVHKPGGEDRWVQLSGEAVRGLAGEHGLGWRELGVLLGLVLMADDRDWLVEGQTLGGLCELLGVGYRTLVAALEVLAARGLVTWRPRRGGACALAVPAGAAMVVLARPGAPKHRAERRELARLTDRGEGPAVALGRRLVARYGLAVPPSPAFLQRLEALLSRVDVGVVEDRLWAMGSLVGAGDAMAVLVHRAERLGVELDAQAAAAARTLRERDEAEAAARAARQAGRDAEATAAGESRWLAEVLDDDTLRGLRDRYLGATVRRGRVAVPEVSTAISRAARAAVAGHPSMDPADAVRVFAGDHLGVDADLELSSVSLPQVRAGPALVERLRPLTS